MNKIILWLTVVFLPGLTLFASTNRPIYTVKDGKTHRSKGANEDECYQSSYYQRENGDLIREDKKCKECNNSKKSKSRN